MVVEEEEDDDDKNSSAPVLLGRQLLHGPFRLQAMLTLLGFTFQSCPPSMS